VCSLFGAMAKYRPELQKNDKMEVTLLINWPSITHATQNCLKINMIIATRPVRSCQKVI
jgi:hypothetical protein